MWFYSKQKQTFSMTLVIERSFISPDCRTYTTSVNLPHPKKGHCFKHYTGVDDSGGGLYCRRLPDRPLTVARKETLEWAVPENRVHVHAAVLKLNCVKHIEKEREKRMKKLELKWCAYTEFPHGQFDFIVHEMATHCRWVVLLAMPKPWKNKMYIFCLIQSVTHSWW